MATKSTSWPDLVAAMPENGTEKVGVQVEESKAVPPEWRFRLARHANKGSKHDNAYFAFKNVAKGMLDDDEPLDEAAFLDQYNNHGRRVVAMMSASATFTAWRISHADAKMASLAGNSAFMAVVLGMVPAGFDCTGLGDDWQYADVNFEDLAGEMVQKNNAGKFLIKAPKSITINAEFEFDFGVAKAMAQIATLSKSTWLRSGHHLPPIEQYLSSAAYKMMERLLSPLPMCREALGLGTAPDKEILYKQIWRLCHPWCTRSFMRYVEHHREQTEQIVYADKIVECMDPVSGEKPSRIFMGLTRDLAIRFCGSVQNTAVYFNCAVVLAELSQKAMIALLPNKEAAVGVAGAMVEVNKSPYRYHDGAVFLTGKKQLAVSSVVPEIFFRDLAYYSNNVSLTATMKKSALAQRYAKTEPTASWRIACDTARNLAAKGAMAGEAMKKVICLDLGVDMVGDLQILGTAMKAMGISNAADSMTKITSHLKSVPEVAVAMASEAAGPKVDTDDDAQ